MSDDQIKAIRDHIWTKYIDFGHVDDDVDEAQALSTLEEYHRTHAVAVDGETYYLGILYFELAWGQKERDQALFIARATMILERYRNRSGESDWEPLDDRIEEGRSFLTELDPDLCASLVSQVVEELDASASAAEDSAPEEEEVTTVQDGMIFVPAGAFLSGVNKAPRETKAFWIDVYPVTNAEYKLFVEATGYRPPKFWQEGRLREPEAPVVGVSWYDAYKYAAYAGKSLPVKDQWEKAARGSKGSIFPWGDEIDAEKATYDAESDTESDAETGGENGELTDGVANVGLHDANRSEFGVCDMAGNVWEWTESQDPQDSEQRIICGGSWCDDAEFLRCDSHLAAYPKDKYDNIGFRCVRLAE